MIKHRYTQHGYTLIESLVYTAIVALLFIMVIGTLFLVFDVYRTFAIKTAIQDSAITSFERITREIRNASQVSTSGSVFYTHPGMLVLSSTNENGEPITLEFSLDDGALHMYEDGVDQGPLTSNNVDVTRLVFAFSNATSSELIKISMDIENEERDVREEHTFNVSTVLRGSYDQ